uniref:Endonuclease/exonuclease/phosphatase domain-containing protein n=1 Tax=Haplochromis burtoni TaxID=8153 RepID=A0A3Q3CJ61_HAPBU
AWRGHFSHKLWVTEDNEGRYILVKGMLHGETVLLGNIYAPNAQDGEFYTVLFSQLVDMDCANIILAGDFNCVLCPKMDKLPPQSILTKNSKALWQIINEENINGMVQDLREMLTRWRSLPISFLGRINLIKMVILLKILYPTGMLFAILKSEDIKVINKAMVDFIWAGRKP